MIKIPVYEEIVISGKSYDKSSIIRSIKKLNYGRSPLFLNLNHLSESALDIVLRNLEEAIVELKFHPLVPYPVYIITDKIRMHDRFLLVKAETLLPKHFAKPIRKLKSKELSLLGKIGILQEKLNNIDIDEQVSSLHNKLEEHKVLFEITKELYFYETVEAKLKTGQTNEQ